jgi:hypothetical protein
MSSRADDWSSEEERVARGDSFGPSARRALSTSRCASLLRFSGRTMLTPFADYCVSAGVILTVVFAVT